MWHENYIRSATLNGRDVISSQLMKLFIGIALALGTTACTTAIGSAVPASATSSQEQSSAQNAVGVKISPDSPSLASGGKLQFAATVTSTSNSAVVWSASAGSITANGLFTAPASKTVQSVTVTATSAANPLATNSTTVAITGPPAPLAITTTSLPGGVAGTEYSTTLTQRGGAEPYKWSVVDSLPLGLQLDSTTAFLSGLPGKAGTFVFSVRIEDNLGSAAVQKLRLVIASQVGTNCGPPSYPCSRTDTKVIVAHAPPQLGVNRRYYGGHLGAGIIGVDPAYNNRILRVTDGETDSSRPGQSYQTGSSAEKNVTSYDENLFFVHNETGGVCLFQYVASSFNAHFRGCYANIGHSMDFGYTEADNQAFYSYYRQKLYRFVIDTSNWTITTDPSFNHGQGYFDPDDANCLNGQIAANNWYTGDSALSSDDNTVIVAVGPQQDADPYYVVWDAAKGCQWMNVHTWQVSRGWNTGLSHPRSISWASGRGPTEQGGIHNAQIDRSGTFGILTVNRVSTLAHKLFWMIGTNQVDDTCVKCKSHWACDFGVCFWNMGPGTGYSLVHQGIEDLNPVLDLDTAPVQGQWGNDEHLSHANAEPGEKLIYLASWQPGHGASSVTQVWEDEIVGVNWDGSQRTIRFNKNWASGYSGFNGSSRCSISRQGHYAICDSDLQMYNLDKGFGNGHNQDTCDHNQPTGKRNTAGCRTDILLFELR